MFTHALLLCVNLQFVVYCKHIQIALIEILFLISQSVSSLLGDYPLAMGGGGVQDDLQRPLFIVD